MGTTTAPMKEVGFNAIPTLRTGTRIAAPKGTTGYAESMENAVVPDGLTMTEGMDMLEGTVSSGGING